jgi:O-acetylhomoserine/O-acetylserine sulfhydrylase-like pyridoxal-dependent enzyme
MAPVPIPARAMPDRKSGFATLCLPAGQQPDPAIGARALPIPSTSSIIFASATHAAVGDAKASLGHPAATTPRQPSGEQRARAGVTPEKIRLSVGLETRADILRMSTMLC